MSIVQLTAAWERIRRDGTGFYLATVVRVEGSAYRKPGAHMLFSASGQRVGTISGGCLEAEVVRKAAWLTSRGPCVQVYRSDDDEQVGRYGNGCGGTVWVLVQGAADAKPILEAISRVVEDRRPVVLVCTLRGLDAGRTTILSARGMDHHADRALAERCAVEVRGHAAGELPDRVYLPVLPPPELFIFGAGDDAVPLARFAVELGWKVTIADGRAQLLLKERFPETTVLRRIDYGAEDRDGLLSATNLGDLGLSEEAFAVLLTHSFQQDRSILEGLLSRPVRYVGVLGPRRRTVSLVQAVAGRIRLEEGECMKRIHAPIGLPIGFDSPATIALSIVAEIQAELEGKDVRVSAKTRPPH